MFVAAAVKDADERAAALFQSTASLAAAATPPSDAPQGLQIGIVEFGNGVPRIFL